MQSRTTRQFWRLFSHLPAGAQRDAKRSYRLFQTNPAHPGLQFKKLEGEDNIYSIRIGLDYRALAVMNRDRVVWYLDRQSQRVRPFGLRSGFQTWPTSRLIVEARCGSQGRITRE
jgi:hypothetical protein